MRPDELGTGCAISGEDLGGGRIFGRFFGAVVPLVPPVLEDLVDFVVVISAASSAATLSSQDSSGLAVLPADLLFACRS